MDQDLQALFDAPTATPELKGALYGVQAQRDWLEYAIARDQVIDQRRAEDNVRNDASLAAWKAQALSSASAVQIMARQEAQLLNPVQERFMCLFSEMLKTRLGPAIITSTTPKNVVDDIVTDAVGMAVVAAPLIEAELAKLA